MALITAAEARSLITALGASTDHDTWLDTLILVADALMAKWCGFPAASAGVDPTLEDVTYTEYYHAPDYAQSRRLTLRVRPVQSVTTVHSDPDWGYGSSYEIVSGDRTLFGDRGEIWLNPDASAAFHSSPRAIKVVYVAGFATIPESVKLAARIVVQNLFARVPHEEGVSEVSQRGITRKLNPELFIPSSAKALLTDVRMWEGVVG